MTGTLSKVDLNVGNFELWMTVMLTVESADQIWWWIIVVMVHMHHSQPLKMKFGTNHFLGSETLVPLQYRVRVNIYFFRLMGAVIIYKYLLVLEVGVTMYFIFIPHMPKKPGHMKQNSCISFGILTIMRLQKKVSKQL